MQPLQLQDYNSASGDESDESGAKLNENYGVMRCQAFKQCWSFHVLYTNGGQPAMFCPSQFKETRILVAVPELHSQGRRGLGFFVCSETS